MSKPEWKKVKFDNVVIDRTKLGTKIERSYYLPDGVYPVVDQGKELIAGYRDEMDGLFSDVPVIIFGDHTRIIKYIDFPFFLGADGVKLLKTNNNSLNCKYLYYYLLTQQIPNTGYNRHFKWLKEIEILFPQSLDHQRHIAATLDKANELIALRKKQLKDLDALAEAVFYDMFGDPVRNEKGWKIGSLDEFCAKITDGEHFRPITIADGIPFLSAKDITNGYVSFDDVLYINEDTAKKALKRCNPEYGDILLISRGATIGKVCRVETKKVFCLLGSVVLLKIKQDKTNSYFVKSLLMKESIHRILFNMSGAAAQQAIYLKDIKRLNLPLPPVPLQTRFAAIIEKIEAQKAQVRQALKESEDLFQRLMQDLFHPN